MFFPNLSQETLVGSDFREWRSALYPGNACKSASSLVLFEGCGASGTVLGFLMLLKLEYIIDLRKKLFCGIPVLLNFLPSPEHRLGIIYVLIALI